MTRLEELKNSPFEELLDKDRSVTIHGRNLLVLVTDLFKIYKNLSPAIVAKIFYFARVSII